MGRQLILVGHRGGRASATECRWQLGFKLFSDYYGPSRETVLIGFAELANRSLS
jgi:hypothetical protein